MSVCPHFSRNFINTRLFSSNLKKKIEASSGATLFLILSNRIILDSSLHRVSTSKDLFQDNILFVRRKTVPCTSKMAKCAADEKVPLLLVLPIKITRVCKA